MRFHYLGLMILFFAHAVNAVDMPVKNELTDIKFEAMLSELIQPENIGPYLAHFKKNEKLSWQISAINVNHQVPAGLIVYVSPTNSGHIYEMWKPVIEANNLVWISANNAGNDYPARRRVLQALLAVQLAQLQFPIDKRRIYIAGFSGGGRVASMISPLYPQIFTGAIFMGGANFWGDNPPEKIELLRKNPQVFINGEQDFNRDESKRVLKKFEQAGVEHTTFIDVPKLGHMPPDETWLAKAIDYLDNNNASHILKQ